MTKKTVYRIYTPVTPGGSELKSINLDCVGFMEYFMNTYCSTDNKMDKRILQAWEEIKERLTQLEH